MHKKECKNSIKKYNILIYLPRTFFYINDIFNFICMQNFKNNKQIQTHTHKQIRTGQESIKINEVLGNNEITQLAWYVKWYFNMWIHSLIMGFCKF